MGVQLAIGGTVAWHCDNDPGASRILAHHWPDVPNLGDITAVDWASVEPVDVLTAGYPCQPFSDAGKRKGSDDVRYLWPEVARAIRVLGPKLVVLENVAGHLRRGFREVLGSLAEIGYDAEWTCVRASEIGAPHRRERLFVVGYPASDHIGHVGEPFGRGSWRAQTPTRGTGGDAANSERQGWGRTRGEQPSTAYGAGPSGGSRRCGDSPATDATSDGRNQGWPEPARLVGRPDVAECRDAAPADALSSGRAGRSPVALGQSVGRTTPSGSSQVAWGAYEPAIRRWERLTRPAPAPTEPGSKGQPRLSPHFVEWLMGLPAGHVTDVPGLSRNDQLKALGNGVVPQQAAAALRLLLAEERAA